MSYTIYPAHVLADSLQSIRKSLLSYCDKHGIDPDSDRDLSWIMNVVNHRLNNSPGIDPHPEQA